jgi:hypothetical protein
MAAARSRVIVITNRSYAYFTGGDFSTAARAQFVADIAFDGTLAEPTRPQHPPKWTPLRKMPI